VIDDFKQFLQQQVARHGPWRVVLAPYSLVPVLGGFAGLFDSRLAFLAAGLALFLWSAIGMLWLAHRLRVERNIGRDLETLVNSYADLLLGHRPIPFRHEHWVDYIVVDRDGNAIIDRYLTVRVVDPDRPPVVLVWVTLYPSTRPLMSAAERGQVTVVAHRFTPINGEYVGRPGSAYTTTLRWEPDNRLRVMVHLAKHLQYQDVAHIHLRWQWPRYLRNVIDGGRDFLEWNTTTGIDNLTCTITFAEGCRLGDGLDVEPFPGTPAVRYHKYGSGKIQIDLDGAKAPVGGANVGIYLDATRSRP
jgi:hypothetical protein